MDVTVILPPDYNNEWIRKIIDAFDALGWEVKFAQVKSLYAYPTQPYWTGSGQGLKITNNMNWTDKDQYYREDGRHE